MSADQIYEEYTDTRTLKILTENRLSIPGLSLFGRQVRNAAIDTLPPHHHGNNYEIVYVASGSPSFWVGGQNFTLSGGDVFITHPYEIHSTDSRPVSVSEIYWLQLDLEKFHDPLFLVHSAGELLSERLERLMSPVIHTDLVQMKRLLQSSFRVARSGENPQLAAQYLTLFLFLLPEYAQREENKVTADIQTALDFIREHVENRISLEDLAGLCYLSVSQFKQKFKQQTGMAPRQYINLRKIEQAKALLLQGHSTKQTAELLNFENSSYFVTVFRRYTSCTPSQFLNRRKTDATDKFEKPEYRQAGQ